MSETSAVVRRDGGFEVSGRMTFHTVPGFLEQTQGWFTGNGAFTIDLGKITLADSAGLALMVEWLRQAKSAGRQIRFINLPEQVRHLIRVSGLSDVFESA